MTASNQELMAKALTELRRLKSENAALRSELNEPVAVVGMACRFPGGSDNPEAFWRLLEEGRSGIGAVPGDRREAFGKYAEATGEVGTDGVHLAGFIGNPEAFDARFFGISPKEARSLDPQQRLLLELAWECLEQGGVSPDELAGREVGIFIGQSGIDYALKLFQAGGEAEIDPYFGTGGAQSPAAGRLSYFLKVTGPSMVVDTACSSSLVALHLACESLRKGECEAALVGGVNRILSPQLSLNFARSGLLATDGQCHTFDAGAHGYARGEGGGMLLLKRQEVAEVAGDVIQALILGSATNQDGGSGGLTVPSGPSQQRVIRRALDRAGVAPAEIDYVETHGTATPLGDPIEANALGEVFRERGTGGMPLRIGSVKTNFGHLEAAAGMAGVCKVILSLNREKLPPHRNFTKPSPHIDWERYPLEVVASTLPWHRGERRRIAGVSGFGFAGTNAHVVIAEAPSSEAAVESEANAPELILLSAKTPEALTARAGTLAEYLDDNPGTPLPVLASTLQSGRAALSARLGLTAASVDEASALLKKFAGSDRCRGVHRGDADEVPEVAFVFTGQGAQYRGMGRALYQRNEYFRNIIDECAHQLEPMLGEDLRAILFEEPEANSEPGARNRLFDSLRNQEALGRVDETRHTQPALFVIEYALARLWQSWGVRPKVVLGHSVGEYAAACVAGVFSLADGLKLVAARGRLMEELSDPGAMLTVFAEESVVEGLLRPDAECVSIAAVNGPGIILVSGAVDAIDAVEKRVEAQGLRSTRMRISHAFHSPLTEAAIPAFREVLDSVELHAPGIPLISNVTGSFADDSIATPEYWVRHLRGSVRFNESMTLLHEQHLDFFIEVGPEPTLTGLDLCFREVREQAASQARWVVSLRRGHDDWRSLLDSIGALWSGGLGIDWKAVNGERPAPRLCGLPAYPFQRKRHWFEPTAERVPACFPPERPQSAPATATMSAFDADTVYADIVGVISEISGLESADLSPETSLLEMGLDSLMFVRMGRVLEKRYSIDVPIRRFYEELHRIGILRDHILTEGTPPDRGLRATSHGTSDLATTPTATAKADKDNIHAVMQRHLALMEQYLELSAAGRSPSASSTGVQPVAPSALPVRSQATRNFAGLERDEHPGLTEPQRAFIAELVRRYNQRTAQSKARTQEWRRSLADWKGSLQFKKSLKELKYPIVCERARGARLWDIDGNEYIDFALGMGVHFFGHRPEPVRRAVAAQLDRGAALGPQSDLAGVVARKICELTGAERVSLAITGSGAVMLAQRLARAATGKPLIAQFGGAYHGIGSEVLAWRGEAGTEPLSPGIPEDVVRNTLVLDYGSEEALERIQAHADQLAAVIVEPVQSRRPGYQPHRFLRRLRKLTSDLGIALIFDEMINGFRIHPGGAQAWFGIKADLVTYGKIIGGGMPLAAVAGKARYLDLIDGGYWEFGDDSVPADTMIFTGGTHNRHPLALAAANAVLDHMREEGPALQERVNARTERMVRALNAFLEAEAVAMRVTHFGSQFRFEAIGDGAFEMEVFFYLLTFKGFYTWEQRICCVSTEHTDADLTCFVEAVREAVAEMRAGGFAMRAGDSAPRRIYPLSSVQLRLFALCQREGGEFPYHLTGMWEIEGEPDAFRIEDAFQEIVRRHESLRTAFVMIGDEPRAWLIEEPRFFLETIEAGDRPADDLLKAFIRPFDLEKPPLLRVGLARRSTGNACLLIDAHHIAVDGLSMNTILREFCALYDGIVPRPVSRQYRHAMADFGELEHSPNFAAQEAYWAEQLAGGIPALELPTDFPRASVADFRGDKLLLRVDPDRTTALEELARAHGASLYMLLMAAFATLLHRLAAADELVVGLPVSGRPGTDNEDVVGMFVNSLPLRFRPRGETPFADFLERVRGICLDAYQHQGFPYERMVALSGSNATPGRNPLFDTMFAYENADDRLLNTADLTIRTIDQFEGSGMFDFNVDVIREAGRLNVRFHYATSLFRRETVASWLDAFERLLSSICSDPTTTLSRLELWNPAEISRVSGTFNPPDSEDREESTLVEAWTAACERQPFAVAVECEGRQLRYGELDARSIALACHLADRGVGVGDRVVLLLDSSEDLIVCLLAVLRLRATYVPVDLKNPVERVRFIVEDCSASVILTDQPNFPPGGAPVVTLAEVPETVARSRDLPPPEPGDLAYIIYTSGSTGRPKGVLIEHRSILSALRWRIDFYAFTSADCTLQIPSYAFDASLLDIFPVLLAGGRLLMVPGAKKQDLNHIGERIREGRVTNLLLTPSLYALYLEEIARDLKSLRFVTLAGESTSLSLLRRHFEALPGVRLFNEYGPTENSVVTACGELFANDEEVSIGKPIPGRRVDIIGPGGIICPPGIRGELVISGSGLARGYLNRPDIEQAVFVDAPWAPGLRIYRTGDYARWTRDGRLLFEGRIDGQVKLHGYRIEMGEIESALLFDPRVKEATARVVENSGEAQLVAYLVPKPGFSESALRMGLAERLPSYMVPTIYISLVSLPRNQSGKIDSSALPLPEREAAAGARPPLLQGEQEERLGAIWRSVLGRESIGRNDDYFRLGGDSIKAIQVISRLAAHGWQFEMEELFRSPTIAGLAPMIRRVGYEQTREMSRDGDCPLSAIQSWYLRCHGERPDHFNQAVWLEPAEEVSPEILRQALSAVWKRHDVFALSFRRDRDNRWVQSYKNKPLAPELETVEVADAAEAEAVARRTQGSLSLGNDVLFRAVYCRGKSQKRLLIVIHHLLIDGISWRVLIEDLEFACRALLDGREPVWERDPTPFAAWTEAQREAAGNESVGSQQTYWKSVMDPGLPELPNSGHGRAVTVGEMASISLEIPAGFAGRLFGEANSLMSTRGNELPLTALREAFAEWNPGRELYVMLEGHGREASISRLDYGSTVGWFTSHYPVRFPIPETDDRVGLIASTKARLRGIPDNGAGYLLLRELAGFPGLVEGIEPEISFNFLGSFDDAGADRILRLLSERPPESVDPTHRPHFALALYGWVSEDVLYWVLEYDALRFSEEQANALLQTFQAQLESLIGFCLNSEAVPRQSCDFQYVQLDAERLERLLTGLSLAAGEVDEIYPLTPMQHGLFYEARKDVISDAYFEQMSFRLEGDLDIEAFSQAWKRLSGRYPALRSVFVDRELEQPLQLVRRHQELPFEVHDFISLDEDERAARVRIFQEKDRRRQFDLESGPLMRVGVLRLDQRTVQVIWSHHHILMDGWCVGVLYEDLMALYAEEVAGRPPALSRVPDYGTYWRWREGLDVDRSRRFWETYLEDYTELATVPRMEASAGGEHRHAEFFWQLDKVRWERLSALAARYRATPATLLQTLWGVLLARYNNTRDVVFGAIVSGRPESLPDVERMVGLFINAVPLRFRIDAETSFTDALEAVQDSLNARRAHEYIALAEINEAGGALREYFDHLVVLENYPMDESLRGESKSDRAEGLRLHRIEGYERTHYDFNLVAVPKDGLELKFAYNAAVYSQAFIENVASHIDCLVDAVLAAPETPCITLPVLSEDEFARIRNWNDTDADFPREATVTSLFAEQARLFADRPAVSDGRMELGYRELDEQSNRIAHALVERGLERGECVVAWLERDVRMAAALLGIAKAGGVYVPLDLEYPRDRLTFMIEDCGARFAVSHSADPLPFTIECDIHVDELKEAPVAEIPSPPRPDDALYVIYTSGSTGKPKGCRISHRNVVRLMRNERHDFDFHERDVWVIAHSFCFDFSVWEMYGALLNGGRAVIPAREEVRDTRQFVNLVIREGVTILNQTPAAFYAFAEEALRREHDLGAHLRCVVFGGDRLEPGYLEPWTRRYSLSNIALINMYGITETTVHVTHHHIQSEEVEHGTGRSLIGRPLPETQVWVLDERMNPLPVGVAGELHVGGSGVCLGYLNRPELNAQRFVPHPFETDKRLYRTGDIGRWRPEGVLEYLGRNDQQVQVRGFRVETGEIEAALLAFAGIAKAVVLPREESNGQTSLAAWLVGEEMPAPMLRLRLMERLPDYMVPSWFVWLEELPLTANGKIDRRALPDVEASRDCEYEAPRNSMEADIVAAWTHVLERETIGIRENFFELGGQSLKAVRLVGLLEERHGWRISLRDFFARPTVAEQAALLAPSVPESTVPVEDPDLLALMDGLSPEELEAHLEDLER